MNIAFHMSEWLVGILAFIGVTVIGAITWLLLVMNAAWPSQRSR